MKQKSRFLTTILLVGLVLATSIWATNVGTKKNAQEEEISESWLEQAMANIEKDEYQIRNVNGEKISTNNAQNLKFNYSNNGFSVSPLELSISDKEIKNWKADFTIIGFGRGNEIEYYFNGEDFSSVLNEASISDNNLEVKYLNNKKGMRQDFIVKKKPTNEKGLLTLRFNINTEENIVVGANALMIKDSKNILMRYEELKVWDANGKELRGWFESRNNVISNDIKKLVICVNDENATYPITIDPISTTEDWSATGANSGDEFGYSVATAGDVNGDGRSDILIGAPQFDITGHTSAGKVYLYYGGATGPSATADWTFEGSSTSENVGNSVATAGDMNGDGYSDVIIGAYGYNGAQGRVHIFLSQGSSGLPSSTNIYYTGEVNSYFGISVAPAGDFNGDGYSDVIVGAPYYTDGSTEEEGVVYVFYGAATENDILNGTAWTVEGNSTFMNFGQSVNFAGDIDKDGYSDIIVGAPFYDDATIGSDVGKVFVFHGDVTPSTTAEAERLGAVAGDQFGFSVSTAGDINGDGYSDVMIGAPYFDYNSKSASGIAYLFYGSSSTISLTNDWYTTGADVDEHRGYSVSTAGDINGDGYGDVIIGIPHNDYSSNSNSGLTYAYFGSSTGFGAGTDWGKFKILADTYFGNSVATAGDVNGDGYSDVIVGAYKEDVNGTDDGKVYLFFGSPSGVSTSSDWDETAENSSTGFGQGLATAGDVNGDGYTDVIIGDPNYNSSQGKVYLFRGSYSGLSTTASWTAVGEATNQSFGFSVATAGDVNGDGYSDVIIGAPEFDGTDTDQGKVYVYYGTSSSPYLSSTPDWTSVLENAGLKLGYSVSSAGDINGDGYSDIIWGMPYYTSGQTNEGAFAVSYGSDSGPTGGVTIESNSADALLGFSVSSAGDLNGDVFSDVVVGAYGFSNGEASEGKVFIHLGTSSGLNTTPAWSVEGNVTGAQIGVSVACAGDVNADGLTDIIVGANGGDGLALVLYGDNSTTINSAYTTLVGPTNGAFGTSVSSAGDVDGNGYSDVIVGAPLYDGEKGAAYLFQSDVSGLSTTADWGIVGTTANDEYGTKVAVAGDVDGNGYSDVLTFAPNISGGSVVYTF